MGFAADLHVHFYPQFLKEGTIENVLDIALKNLDTLWSQSGRDDLPESYLICLTERFDCHFFKQISSGSYLGKVWQVARRTDDGAVVVARSDGGELIICPGRQIVTSERLELLALTSDCQIPDGLAFAEAAELARSSKALAVLNWAPGKWMFGRRAIAEKIIRRISSEKLILGDTSLRPWGWSTPELFKLGATLGLPIIAGSDPLPFSGEQCWVGTKGIVSDQVLARDRPIEFLRDLLTARPTEFSCWGKPQMPWTVARRILTHTAKAKLTKRKS